MPSMATADLREQFVSALPSSFDADTTAPSASRLFTPVSHRRALEPDVTIVRGARGVGKTVWFASLQEPRLRQLAAATYRLPVLHENIQVSAGFGTLLNPEQYPVPTRLISLYRMYGAENVWRAITLNSLGASGITDLQSWEDRVALTAGNPSLFEESLARADAPLRSASAFHLILFDALDRMSSSAEETDGLVAGLLRVALDVRTRTRRIRIKIFSRPDILERPLSFTDASKITANAVDLSWSFPNLFGLLFTTVGNDGDPSLAHRFRAETEGWEEITDGVWRSAALSADQTAQQRLFTDLAGEYMGANHRRGRSYTWLPNHLADGRGQVSPRSFLSALRHAVDDTRENRSDHPLALHWDSIRRGVQQASAIRVQEISEDIPWVESTIRPLTGMQVPMTLDSLFTAWDASDLQSSLMQTLQAPPQPERPRLGPRDAERWEGLFTELQSLGVMTRRSDGRVDLPDVYRVAFGLGRRGGVPRAT